MCIVNDNLKVICAIVKFNIYRNIRLMFVFTTGIFVVKNKNNSKCQNSGGKY